MKKNYSALNSRNFLKNAIKLLSIQRLMSFVAMFFVMISASSQTYEVSVIDKTATSPLAKPTPADFAPRYISGLGSNDAFTVFFEDRTSGSSSNQPILFNSTTTGPTGFSTTNTSTGINPETHFLIKDWPITINGTTYDYRAWGSVDNNTWHKFYVSNDLLDWVLVSTFTIPNNSSFYNDGYFVFYGFHDVIQLNGTYYAFAEDNGGHTVICRSENADDVWEAFACVGGVGKLPLQSPAGGPSPTPTGNFFPLKNDLGYGKLMVYGNNAAFYLAVNFAAKPNLPPDQFEAAFIDPNNWKWNDGTQGIASNPVFTKTGVHDLRECWMVPKSDPNTPWTIIYTANFGSSQGGMALGYALMEEPRVHNITRNFHYYDIQPAINEADPGNIIEVDAGTYNEAITINKSLTLRGDPNGARPKVNLPNGVANIVSIVASNINIEYFHILKNDVTSDAANINIQRTGGWPYYIGYENITLKDLIIEKGRRGIFITGKNVSILDCQFLMQSRDAIYINAVSGTTNIKGNYFKGNKSTSQKCIAFENFSSGDPAVSGTINIEGNQTDPTQGKNNFMVYNQWVDPNQKVDLNIKKNIISGLGSSAVVIYDWAGADPSRFVKINSVTVEGNSFTNIASGKYAILNPEVQGNPLIIQATCNWYGSANEGSFKNKIKGNVIYIPYLISDDLDNPQCFGGCSVTVWRNGNLISAHVTIQAGIDAAANGDEVRVAAGTYSESVDLKKSVSLIGEGCGNTVWQGNNITDRSLHMQRNNSNPDNIHVEISGFSFETENNQSIYGHWNTNYSQALTLDIHDNCFKHVNSRNPGYDFAIWVAGANQASRGTNGAIRVYDNICNEVTGGFLFENCKAVDVFDNVINTTYEGVTFNYYGTNNGDLGDHLVRGNTFNHVPVAWAFGMNNYFGAGSYTVLPCHIEHNVFTNSGFYYAVTHNIQKPQSPAVNYYINNNSILSGTLDVWGSNSTDIKIDATCNWYGTIHEAEIKAKIQGDVKYFPYKTDAGPDSCLKPSFKLKIKKSNP